MDDFNSFTTIELNDMMLTIGKIIVSRKNTNHYIVAPLEPVEFGEVCNKFIKINVLID